MSFGLGISFGRVCRQRMSLDEIVKGPRFTWEPSKFESPETLIWDQPGCKVMLRGQPKEPTSVVEKNGWIYYYNEHGQCYGQVVQDFDKIDPEVAVPYNSSVVLPRVYE